MSTNSNYIAVSIKRTTHQAIKTIRLNMQPVDDIPPSLANTLEEIVRFYVEGHKEKK